MVPGQQSHHSSDDADKVEHGVGHLALEGPVRVGWRITGDADATVGKRHNEVHRHTAQHDYPVNHRLQDMCMKQQLDTLRTTPLVKACLFILCFLLHSLKNILLL